MIAALLVLASAALAAGATIVTDHTSYNAGSEVRIRLQGAASGRASIRYAGAQTPIEKDIPVSESGYAPFWKIPWEVRAGRYEVDLVPAGGAPIRNATSFAVHRQLAKVMSVELDKTFYTSGDSVNPRIVVRNISNRPLQNLQVEFEPYTYPWIAAAPDEPPIWKKTVSQSLSLAPGEPKEFEVPNAATVQADKEPVVIYYSVVIRDSRNPDRIYDLAFAPAIFAAPVNRSSPKQYPFLYLYGHLRDMPQSEAYRHFYPPRFVSGAIDFETTHTMFGAGTSPAISFSVTESNNFGHNANLRVRVLTSDGKEVLQQKPPGALTGKHTIKLEPLGAGLYTVTVSIETAQGAVVARNQLELGVNPLPKSILVFCAHEDDDTAHPALIRAAVENQIPIHFVYFTSGDAGGCDRFYMHSCDAERALDFGDVRMEEARASLGHLGVPGENISFLGLPDGGLEQIWDHHRDANHPYLSVLLASDHAPYTGAAIPNLPYAREPVIAAAKQFIERFKPDMIVTGHPDERHVDHRTNNWIVVKAMQELLKSGVLSRETKLLVDAVYGPAPEKRAPYHYERERLYVSGEVARLGQEATWYYQSQEGNHEQAKIVDFGKLSRGEPYPHFRIVDWPQHEGWNERR